MFQAPLRDPEELRKELEQQLEAWQRQTPGEQEEVNRRVMVSQLNQLTAQGQEVHIKERLCSPQVAI